MRAAARSSGFLPIPCPWSSTTARSAAMLGENARPFTSAPRESPNGSSPLPPTPVEFLSSAGREVFGCLPRRQEQRPELLHSLRPQNRHHKPLLSIFFITKDRLQLWSASLNLGTCSKSARFLPAARCLTESLPFIHHCLTTPRRLIHDVSTFSEAAKTDVGC